MDKGRAPVTATQSNHGRTTVYMGPMFSGKTSKMFEHIRAAALGLKRVSVIKWDRDVRYSSRPLASSHDGAHMHAIAVADLKKDPADLPADVQVIGIDEAQFLDGVAEFCKRQNRAGRDVVVAGLNHKADVDRSAWPNMIDFMSFARIHTMRSTCVICQSDDALCSRLVEGTPLQGRIEVGVSNFVATCEGCYEAPLTQEMIDKRAAVVAFINGPSVTFPSGALDH